jgi:multiple sugar transport system permease protein
MADRIAHALKDWMRDAPRLLLLALLAAVFLMPYAWMLAVSVKPKSEVFSAALSLWPATWHAAENYGAVLREVPILRYLWNGVVVCALILVFQLAFALPAGYALAKLRFRGSRTLFAFVMLGLLVPAHVPAIALYIAFASAKMLNTYTALVAPFTISVFAIFLFRQFFKALPDDLVNAARIDGMGEASIVWRVAVPNAWPAATAFAIFSVVAHWSDLFWPLIVVTKGDLYTPALGVLRFHSQEAGDDYGALMAAATLTMAPLVAAFLVAQRRFIEGITMTGIKG